MTFREESLPEPVLSRPARSNVFYWGIAVVIAWISFELTAQPAVGVVISCLKFGWNDACDAIWLWRTDPHRGRARACSCFCLSLAMYKVVMATTFILMLLVLILKKLDFANNQNNASSLAALACVALVGFPASALFATIGCIFSKRHSVPVWIDQTLHVARQRGQSPGCRMGARNLIRAVFVTSVAVGIFLQLFLVPCFLRWPSATMGFILMEILLFSKLWNGVIASDPEACWNLEAVATTDH